MVLKPAFGDNPLMQLAFRDFVFWLWDQEVYRRLFETETKTPPLLAAKTPLEAMIDEATGANGEYVEKFVEWAIKTQWGEEEK